MYLSISDGKTKSKDSFEGEIGMTISPPKTKRLERAPMVQFQPLDGKVTWISKELLQNQDIRNLYYLCILVQTGPWASHDIAKYFDCTPGTVSFARWITTANNVLCLYCQTENPTYELILLTQIILNIYAPAIFNIKEKWHISNGSLHFFNTLVLARSFLEESHPDLFKIVIKEMTINGFYCHPEALILSMIHDPNPTIKEKGIALIEQCRNAKPTAIVRRFEVPPHINFQAQHYYDLLDFSKFGPNEFCSPPLLSNFSIDEIRNLKFDRDYDMIPCHSQHVERFVSLTSKAAQTVTGEANVHAWILNNIYTTSKDPLHSPKEHYVQKALEMTNQVNKAKEKVKRNLFDSKIETRSSKRWFLEL